MKKWTNLKKKLGTFAEMWWTQLWAILFYPLTIESTIIGHCKMVRRTLRLNGSGRLSQKGSTFWEERVSKKPTLFSKPRWLKWQIRATPCLLVYRQWNPPARPKHHSHIWQTHHQLTGHHNRWIHTVQFLFLNCWGGQAGRRPRERWELPYD